MDPDLSNRISKLISSAPVKGLLVGLAATSALDWVSIVLYERESRKTWLAENFARRGRHAYEVGISKIFGLAGKRLSRRQERKYGWRFHKTFGVASGLQYEMLRKKSPLVGAGMGLLFGAAFFLIVDELMMPLFGFTPGPRKFSWSVHARGAASHLAYGVAAEATSRLIDKVAAATATPNMAPATA